MTVHQPVIAFDEELQTSSDWTCVSLVWIIIYTLVLFHYDDSGLPQIMGEITAKITLVLYLLILFEVGLLCLTLAWITKITILLQPIFISHKIDLYGITISWMETVTSFLPDGCLIAVVGLSVGGWILVPSSENCIILFYDDIMAMISPLWNTHLYAEVCCCCWQKKGHSYEGYTVPRGRRIYLYMLLNTEVCFWARCARNAQYIVKIYTFTMLSALAVG